MKVLMPDEVRLRHDGSSAPSRSPLNPIGCQLFPGSAQVTCAPVAAWNLRKSAPP